MKIDSKQQLCASVSSVSSVRKFLAIPFFLLLISCNIPEPQNLQDSRGYFAFNTEKPRTILPKTERDHFSSYSLKFTSDDHEEIFLEHITYDALYEPVPLKTGEWSLEVTAYLLNDSGSPSAAAYGEFLNIQIIPGEKTEKELVLLPVFNQGTGTFRWDISFDSTGVTAATMTITSLDDPVALPVTVDLAIDKTGAETLDSGQYGVFITLEKTNYQDIKIYEILHIYQNMTSSFSEDLDTYSISTLHTVSFNSNGTIAGTATVTHGDPLLPVDAITPPARTGFIFDGWCTDRFTINKYDYNQPVYGSFTLYAKWVPVASVSIEITPPATAGVLDLNPTVKGNFKIDSVTWYDLAGAVSSPETHIVQRLTVYTVVFELTVFNGYTFESLTEAEVNADTATPVLTDYPPSYTNLTVSYTFDATLPGVITGIAIKTTLPVFTYTHGNTVDLTVLEVTLTYSDASTEDFPYSSFGTNILLSIDGSTISSSPLTLSRSTHNGKTILITAGSESVETDPFVILQATAPSITWPTASSVTYGAALSTSTLSGGSTGYGSFAWTALSTIPTVSNTGYSVTFTPNTEAATNFTGWATTNTVSITVNPATLTISISGITKVYDGTAGVSFTGATLSFNGLVNSETATVNTAAVTATYNNASVGTGKEITINSGLFTMTGGTATASNYSITQPTGLTGAITLYSPSAPGAPTLNSKTINSVTLNKPAAASLDALDSYLTLEYGWSATNNSSTVPTTGAGAWQEGLTFNGGFTQGVTYYFFARYKADATKNNASAASSPALAVTTPVNATITITGEQIRGDDWWPYNYTTPVTFNRTGSTDMTFTLTGTGLTNIVWKLPTERYSTVAITGNTETTFVLRREYFADNGFDDGMHSLTVEVVIGGVLYGKTIWIEVKP